MRVVATAGHVDHGKSTLITFLTGTDPDRWAEEKRRGLTIDLGFASTELPSGREVGFVDVPGHARFIKNMLAGVGATDACLFVVAANEGWQPQSEEHLRILELLGMRHGLVALTKVELAGAELSALAEMEVADHVKGSFLQGAPVVAVDVVAGTGTTGDGGLVATLDRLLDGVPAAVDVGRPRLWIDRSFPIRGSGTVVTGSLTGGKIAVGDHLTLRPQETDVRVRALQSHGRQLDLADPGRRLAVNLVGVNHHDISRGQALVRPAQWHRASVIDASLTVIESVPRDVTRRGSYLAYFGSGEYPVRLRPIGGGKAVAPGATGWVRIWLPVALPLVPGDRFVLRDAGPQQTVGGGEVLDVAPRRSAPHARPSRSVERVVDERGWIDADELGRLTGLEAAPTLGRWVVSPAELATSTAELRRRVEAAGPHGLAVSGLDERERAVLRSLDGVTVEHGQARPATEGADDQRARLAQHPLLSRLRAEPFSPPDPADLDRGELRALQRAGLAFERDGIWFASSAIDDATRLLAELFGRYPEGVPVSAIRSAMGTTRKFAIPLIAHLDSIGVTRRRGDLRAAGARWPSRPSEDVKC